MEVRTQLELYNENVGLVYYVVQEKIDPYLVAIAGKEDLLQEGKMALWKACRSGYYKSELGFKPSSYFVKAIWWSCLRYIHQHSLLIRPPEHMNKLWLVWKDICKRVRFSSSGNPDLSDGSWESCNELSKLDDLVCLVKEAVRSLRPRLRIILAMRFEEGKTLEEIGKILGVSKERIRQLVEVALSKIRSKIYG